jgi:hypothetical protein
MPAGLVVNDTQDVTRSKIHTRSMIQSKPELRPAHGAGEACEGVPVVTWRFG